MRHDKPKTRINLCLLLILASLTLTLAGCGDTTETGGGQNKNSADNASKGGDGKNNPNSGKNKGQGDNSQTDNDPAFTKECDDSKPCSDGKVCKNAQCFAPEDPCAKVECKVDEGERCFDGLCKLACEEARQCNGICCDKSSSCIGLQCVSKCFDNRLPCWDGTGAPVCCAQNNTCLGGKCVAQGAACDIDKEILCLVGEFCDEQTNRCVKYADAPGLCQIKASVGTDLNVKIHWKEDGDGSISAPVVIDLDTKDGDPTPAIGFSTWRKSDNNYTGYFTIIKGKPIAGTTDPDILWRSDQLADPFDVSIWWGPATADVDKDGKPEFFVATPSTDPKDTSRPRGIRGVRADGTTIFNYEPGYIGRMQGAIAIGDINADGSPEIVGMGVVLDRDGNLLFKLPEWDTEGTDIPVLVDMNRDGYLDIVDGLRVYLFDKDAYEADNTVFQMNLIPEEDGGSTYPPVLKKNVIASATSAVGYFDMNSSRFPNIVACGYDHAYLADWRGKVISKISAPSDTFNQRGGPPTIANFDSDPEPEFGCAFAGNYVVYDVNLSTQIPTITRKWSTKTNDVTSATTGSTVFDFDGDGKVEVVYNDEEKIRIYKGDDGTVLLELDNPTGTAAELPVLADVDNDGHADMIAVSNIGTPHGLRVFEGTGNLWAPTRAIWNQHAYSVVNINRDGTVPQHQTVNWDQRWLNNFRQNIQPGNANLAPNLIVESDSIAINSCSADAQSALTFRIKNIGDKKVNMGSTKSAVLIYLDGSSIPETPPYKEFELERDLPPNDAVGYTFDFTPEASWTGKSISIEFVADYEARVQECKEDDNTFKIEDIGSARPDLEVSIEQLNGCDGQSKAEVKITLKNTGNAPLAADAGEVRLYRKVGGKVEELIATLKNTKELGPNEEEVFTVEQTYDSDTRDREIIYRAVADEDQKVDECSEDDKNSSKMSMRCQLLG